MKQRSKLQAYRPGRQLRIIEAVCPVCDSVFTGDRNEEGAAEIPGQQRCAVEDCDTFLCPGRCMDHFSFVCAGCGQRFCYLHMQVIEGKDRFCAGCWNEAEACPPIPMRREIPVRKPGAEVA